MRSAILLTLLAIFSASPSKADEVESFSCYVRLMVRPHWSLTCPGFFGHVTEQYPWEKSAKEMNFNPSSWSGYVYAENFSSEKKPIRMVAIDKPLPTKMGSDPVTVRCTQDKKFDFLFKCQ